MNVSERLARFVAGDVGESRHVLAVTVFSNSVWSATSMPSTALDIQRSLKRARGD